MLFLLTLIPLALAFSKPGQSRGWLLSGIGNSIMFLTLFLGAVAGNTLISNADVLLEGLSVRNPRLLPSAALILSLVGGYIILYAGLVDLKKASAARIPRLIAAWSGVALILLFLVTGQFDIYSVMTEFQSRGELLGNRIVEHIMFVAVSLIVGFIAGVGLGLWSFRDATTAPVILYTVGIIQTIPSLALFGVLLVPLASLGNQSAGTVFVFLIIASLIALAAILLFRRLNKHLQGGFQQAALLGTAIISAIPLSLFIVLLTSFIFRSSFVVFTSSADVFRGFRVALLVILVAAFVIWLAGHYRQPGRLKVWLRYVGLGGFALFGFTLVAAIVVGSEQFLGRVSGFSALTVRDLGVSGIGTAPAVIALTLYSLLPMVRNTYAGLNNVDPAITDAGRGMGMTASQRFFQIELPLALPVIMAGVRNAAVALVGIGAIASVIGAGGLGDFILSGIDNASIDQILLGTIPAVLLATLLDASLRGLEGLLTSPGIRQAGGSS